MKKIKLSIASILVITLISFQTLFAQYTTKIYHAELKNGQEIAATPIKEYTSQSETSSATTLHVYPEITFQTMEGIG